MSLRSRRLIIAMVVFTFCSNIAGQNQIPHEWKQIDADGKFSFHLPLNMRETGVIGIENYHKEYTNGKLHVSFDYDPMEVISYPVRPGALGKNQKEISLEIDGKKAYMFVYETTDMRKRPLYVADLYIGDVPNGDVKLRMLIETWRPANLELAETIFRSIRFTSGPSKEN
ncbi:MAG TPA: hypothetical protein VF290_26540 [Pyrinomonadaceae bacterium]